MHPYIYFQGHSVESYSLFAYASVYISGAYYYFSFSSIPLKKSEILLFIAGGYFAQFFGGKLIPLLYNSLVTHHPYTSQTIKLDFWTLSTEYSSRYFHSVFFSMLAYTLLCCKFWNWPVWKVLDRWLIGIFLASAFARIGCLMAGCCFGKPCDLPWAIDLPIRPLVPRHPTQLYMIILETLLVITLWRLSKNKKYDGEVFWTGVLLYSVYRIFIEFFRMNPVAYLGLTHAQLFSVLTFGLSAGVLFFYKNHPPKSYGK